MRTGNLYGGRCLKQCIEMRKSSKYIDSDVSASKAIEEDPLVESRVAYNI